MPPPKVTARSGALNENPNISTILNQKTIDEVVAKFFLNTLPTLSLDPEYESPNEIIQALYDNATTLPTNLSSGKHGNIVLIMKYTLYARLDTGT